MSRYGKVDAHGALRKQGTADKHLQIVGVPYNKDPNKVPLISETLTSLFFRIAWGAKAIGHCKLIQKVDSCMQGRESVFCLPGLG